jgi:hypothetical protein
MQYEQRLKSAELELEDERQQSQRREAKAVLEYELQVGKVSQRFFPSFVRLDLNSDTDILLSMISAEMFFSLCI